MGMHQHGYVCYEFVCDHEGCTVSTLMSEADHISAAIRLLQRGWQFELHPSDGPVVARCPLHHRPIREGGPTMPDAIESTTTVEYCVEVAGVGYVSQPTPASATVGADNPTVFADAEDARALAKRIARDYERLGQPEMATRVRQRFRTVTTSRDDWQ